MDFFKNFSVSDALSKAESLAKKGMEVAESAAGEASKKLQDLGLHEKVGARAPEQPPPSQEELEHYGITQDFQEFIQTLNYSIFRDFPTEHLIPLNQAASTPAPEHGVQQRLNPWQERHARLVCQVVKEVNELRYVSCPRYMTDEHFWHVYFTLVRKYLPDEAYNWTEQSTLLVAATKSGGGASAEALFASLGSSFKQLGEKLQKSSRHLAAQMPGVELTGLGLGVAQSGGGNGEGNAVAANRVAGGETAAAVAPTSPKDILEADPDLEAYLQVAIEKDGEGGEGGDDEGEGGEDDEDLDLDSYLNELSAEVEAAEEEKK